jgi:hypothetical protein
LAELAAREVTKLANLELKSGSGREVRDGVQSASIKPSISLEGKARIQRLEKVLKATIQEEAICVK